MLSLTRNQLTVLQDVLDASADALSSTCSTAPGDMAPWLHLVLSFKQGFAEQLRLGVDKSDNMGPLDTEVWL